MKYLVFIETSDIGVRHCANAAVRMGFTPLFVANLSQYQADTREELLRHAHLDIDTTDEKKVREGLKTLGPDLGAVTSLLDSYIAMAITLSQELGCAGLDPALIHLKDKEAVAALLSEASPKTLRFSPQKGEEAELKKFFSQCEQGIVLKLCNGTGAFGTEIVRSLSDLDPALDRILHQNVPEHMNPESWVAQEFIDGELASCEGYISEGKVSIIGFTGRRKVRNTESQALFPYDEKLSKEARTFAIEAVKNLVERMHIRRGYFHTEFIFSGDRCFLIDANFGRFGGGSLGEMLALSFGRETVDVYQHLLEISFYGKSQFDPYTQSTPVTSKGLFYGAPADLTLEKLLLPIPLTSRHYRLMSDGAQVPAMGSNNWAWIGILTGTSPKVEEEFEQIRVVSNLGVVKPVC